MEPAHRRGGSWLRSIARSFRQYDRGMVLVNEPGVEMVPKMPRGKVNMVDKKVIKKMLMVGVGLVALATNGGRFHGLTY